jgi:hypothetical protein
VAADIGCSALTVVAGLNAGRLELTFIVRRIDIAIAVLLSGDLDIGLWLPERRQQRVKGIPEKSNLSERHVCPDR